MKLKPNQYNYLEWIDSICIDNIYPYEIDSRENVRVVTFPSHINKKPLTHIHYFFYASYWPSLQRLVVPKTVVSGPNCYDFDKDPVIEYYDD